MKYLKYFEQASAYEAYKNGSDYVTPNVSFVEDNDLVFYNKSIDDNIITYNMIDLGLPSGLKWADRNVGAANPEDAGLYFQWADTVGYTTEQVANGQKYFDYAYSDYFDTSDGGETFNKYARNKLTKLELIDDAACINMGSDWRMPTLSDIDELINNTTVTVIDIQDNEYSQTAAANGAITEYNMKGIKFTGLNGNSIFIPASGYCNTGSQKDIGYSGSLWTSELYTMFNSRSVNVLNFYYNGNVESSLDVRAHGLTVRGVHA